MLIQQEESPEYLRLSLGVAITLGFCRGLFYRDARQLCANLLMTYSEGCMGSCAYCGLARERSGEYIEKSFIRVRWPFYPLEEIIDRLKKYQDQFKRVCISMITNSRAVADIISIALRIKECVKLPLSLLICPTILTREDLLRFKQIGVDRIGIALDAPTEQLFDKLRGRLVGGPHRWQVYWDTIDMAIDIFGKEKVGIHLIVGLGESEKQMLQTIQQIQELGASSTLFSFFPEGGSLLAHHSQPPIGQYRRIQLGRYLIHERLATLRDFSFDETGRLLSYGLSQRDLDEVINSGIPFQTTGCPGCNRPYANSRPGSWIRNYPFPLTKSDIEQVREQLWER